MNAIILITLMVLIALPMISSALFLVARVCGVNHQVDAVNAQTIFATTPQTMAC